MQLRKVKGKTSQKIKVGDGTPFTDRAPGLRLDNIKLKSLDWSVKVGLKDGIMKTIEMMEGVVG